VKPYYEHKGVTIYHGDCREVLPELGAIDLIITDPPYGLNENPRRVLSRKRWAATTDYGHFDWDSEPASDEEIKATRAAAKLCIIWGGNYFDVPPSRGWLVWDKLNSGNFADCELAWTNLPTSVRIFRHRWNGMIRDSENDAPRVHPTQKPIVLMAWCLTFAMDAQTVCDPFMGSGPVLVAAKKQGRRAIGIEIEEKYCEIAAKRLSQEVLEFTT
jgi:site-specific DNA-methyltransferase (adenine-specific)